MSDELLEIAYQHLRRQAPAEAFTVLQEALQQRPRHPEVQFLLGLAAFQSGDTATAESRFRQACDLAPGLPAYRFHLGNVLQQVGRLAEAQAAQQAALSLQADFEPALLALFGLQLQAGELVAAAHSLETLIGIGAEAESLRLRLSEWLPAPPGRSHCLPLLEAYPPLAGSLYALAEHSNRQRAYAAACFFYQECLAVTGLPKSPEILCAEIATCRLFNNQPEAARQYFAEASRLAGYPLAYRLWEALCEPIIYRDRADAEAIRARQIAGLEAGLQALRTDLQRSGRERPVALPNLFFLSYQGHNDRELLERMASLRPDPPPLPPRPVRTRRRIGIVSSALHFHATTLHLFQAFAFLAADPRFELCFFHLGPTQDTVTRELAGMGRLLSLANQGDPVPAIAAEACDVLLFIDLGISPRSLLVAGHRLAPVQAAISGHAGTTGLPTIDYYLSNTLVEPENAQDHYSEQLVLFRAPISSVRPQSLEASGQLARLQGSGPHYLCPMTLFKIHPDFDRAVAEILARDSRGRITFFRFMGTDLHTAFMDRLRARLPAADFARVDLRPWASEAELRQLIQQAEVVLDTFHFGGGITSRLALGLGTPVITWPGAFYRGRITLGLYRMLEMEDAIAWEQADYAPLAVAIATDPARRQALHAALLANGDRLFEDLRALEDLRDFLLSL